MGSIKHVFTNAIPDGTNTNIVRPSDWNSEHSYILQDAVSLAGNTAGVLANVSSGTLILAGGNNITVSQDGNSVTISGANAAPAPVNFSAGTTSNNLGAVIFSNSGGVSFGLNGSTITATVATNYQSQGAYLTTARASNDAIGLNTAKTNVTWTANSSGLSLDAGGYAGTGFTTTSVAGVVVAGTHDTNGLKIAVPAYITTAMLSNAATISNINVSAGTTSNNLSNVKFADSNGVSFGLNGSTVTATVKTDYLTAQTNQSAIKGFGASNTGNTAGNTGVSTGIDWVIAGTNNVTVSQSTTAGGPNTIWLSAPNAGGGANLTLQDSATTLQVTKAIFSNANGVSFGFATAASLATVTASVAAQTNQTIGFYATGNTTNNSSTTFDARTAGTWNALGAQTIGFSNGSVQLSVPATSSIVGTSGVSVSTNGSTISVQLVPMSATYNLNALTIAGAQQANSSVSIVPFDIDWPLVFSQVRVAASISGASAANTSSASQAYSLSVVIYTRNASTLSSVWSGKQNSNSFWQSNSTTALAGARQLFATGAATTLVPDRYWVAVHLSTTNTGTGGNTTALGASYSMMVGLGQATAGLGADPWDGGATNQSRAISHGLGLYSTNNTRATIAFSDAAFTQSGNSVTLANVLVNPRNWTLY